MVSTPDSRPPLDPTRVGPATGSAGPWRLEVLDEVGSTNAEVSRRHAAGATHGLVVAAEHQTAGRGRLGRDWVVTPRSSLVVSVLLEPPADADPTRWAWLPLLTGVAAVRALGDLGVRAHLKWPNDVLVEVEGQERKVAGILLERVDRGQAGGGAAAIVGIGLNVHQDAGELPVDTATSLALLGADTDRSRLLGHLLARLGAAYDAWSAGENGHDDYAAMCTTVGRQVHVTLPGGVATGRAVEVDAEGRLVLETGSGLQRLGAGDVVHVRPDDQAPVG